MKEIFYELTINEYNKIKHLNQENNFFKYKSIANGRCYRCGNDVLLNVNNSIYCNNCKEFGLVREGNYFYQLKPKKYEFKYKDKLHELQLTPKQKWASKFIKSTIYSNDNCLIHAVCGAGKTEITFEAISMMLKKNKFVCFAIPRIDILYEVYERLNYYFYETQICILNSKEEKVQHGQVYIMTTNQIIKFKKAFDLIIVDEIDAFPFEYNIKYNFGVLNAKKDNSSIVYLTSTPSKNFINSKINTYVINRRWHGNLLPVPIFIYFDLLSFIKKPQKEYLTFLNKRSTLLFICNINMGYKVESILKKLGIKLKFVHSKEEKRREYIQDFKEGKINVLLTTPILERGVTFKDIDVIVLDSDNILYSKSALIQIAGRVNRNKDYQNGKVYFCYTTKTKKMIEAKSDIKALNK